MVVYSGLTEILPILSDKVSTARSRTYPSLLILCFSQTHTIRDWLWGEGDKLVASPPEGYMACSSPRQRVPTENERYCPLSFSTHTASHTHPIKNHIPTIVSPNRSLVYQVKCPPVTPQNIVYIYIRSFFYFFMHTTFLIGLFFVQLKDDLLYVANRLSWAINWMDNC